MNLAVFKDPSKLFSLVMFIQPSDVEAKKSEFEPVGKQRNVKLVVQPCPYEGIEFLYQVSGDLIGHHISADKALFWQAIALKGDTPPVAFSKISEHHYGYLCAILEQDTQRVARERGSLESLSEFFL